MPSLYYSYEKDTTLKLQRRSKLAEGWMSESLWKQADWRYVCNKHISWRSSFSLSFDRFILPIMNEMLHN